MGAPLPEPLFSRLHKTAKYAKEGEMAQIYHNLRRNAPIDIAM
jgi:hypothetical protein